MHIYNQTWSNERAVEIPIFLEIIKRYEENSILEIGNVLSHYVKTTYDIVDKYEKAKNVMNIDLLKYSTSKKYKLILSISTLEHIGWDEKPQDLNKPIKAIKTMRKLLSNDGTIYMTVPIGYNPTLDNLIKSGKIKFSQKFYLKRFSILNEWKEIKEIEMESAKYNFLMGTANIILIGLIKKNKKIV